MAAFLAGGHGDGDLAPAPQGDLAPLQELRAAIPADPRPPPQPAEGPADDWAQRHMDDLRDLFLSHQEQLLIGMEQRLEVVQKNVIEGLTIAIAGDVQANHHHGSGMRLRFAEAHSRQAARATPPHGIEQKVQKQACGDINASVATATAAAGVIVEHKQTTHSDDGVRVEHKITSDSEYGFAVVHTHTTDFAPGVNVERKETTESDAGISVAHNRSTASRDSRSSSFGLVPKAPTPDLTQTNLMRKSSRAAECEKSRLQRCVEDGKFEVFFGFAIITNAIFIGVQTDHVARHGSEGEAIFDVVGLFYTCLFTIELAMKICCEGKRFFWGSSSLHWNYMDVMIVVSSLIEAGFTIVLWILHVDSEEAAGQSTSQFRILRIMRITRLIKVIRITRIIKFIRALRTMVHQLLSTGKSLLWAMLLLALIIYLFAVLFTQAYTNYCQEILEQQQFVPDGAPDFMDPLNRYWSSLSRSMFTLFQSITGGVSWEAVVLPLSDLGAWSVSLFIGYISFAQFAVLNVLTGVFCQNAIDSAQHDQELVTSAMLANKQQYINAMKNIFAEFDIDSSGTLSVEEFMEHLNDEHVKAYFDAMELDTSDIGLLFTLMNSDSTDEEIDLDEFLSGCLRLRGSAKAVEVAKLTYMLTALSRRLSRFMTRVDKNLSKAGDWQLPAGSVVTHSHHM